MRKPLPEKYPKQLADLVAKLTPLEKAELYAKGQPPQGLSPEQTKELIDQLRRDDPSLTRGGPGFTFEGQATVFASPGTEGFKQDFAKWDEMRKQATIALEQAESALSKKLQAKQAKDRLAAGADDNAPPDYKKQVDSYFKAIAKKKP